MHCFCTSGWGDNDFGNAKHESSNCGWRGISSYPGKKRIIHLQSFIYNHSSTHLLILQTNITGLILPYFSHKLDVPNSAFLRLNILEILLTFHEYLYHALQRFYLRLSLKKLVCRLQPKFLTVDRHSFLFTLQLC